MSSILAIDQGTSGTKAIVVDGSGSVLATAEQPIHPRYLTAGGIEQDPEELLDSILATGRRAAGAAGRPVDAVALANQGETVLAWDRTTGRPLTAAVVWQDRRAESVCRRLADHADEIAARTGLVLDPYFSAPKMRWIRDNLTTRGVVTTTDTWLVSQLCGAFVTDASTASRSLVLGLDDVSWDQELLDLFGLGNEELPAIVSSDDIVGETTAFGGQVPVTGLIVDQQAALLAEACLAPGDAKCTYGTGAFLVAQAGGRAVRSRSGLTASVAWRLRDEVRYCIDGQVYTAGSALRWITDLGLVPGADEVDSVSAASSEGVLCVPALAGLGAPWWDPEATASFTGISLSSGRGQLVRAVLEGIAAQVAELGDAVRADLGTPLSRLRVDGGLTRSRALMQAQADILQLPLDVYPSLHATALGAAACAHVALDSAVTVDDAVGNWNADHTYEPRWSADRVDSFREAWRKAAESTLSFKVGG